LVLAAKVVSVQTTAISSMSNVLGNLEGSALDKVSQMGCQANLSTCCDRGKGRKMVLRMCGDRAMETPGGRALSQ
jgi:hypothetical protein